MMKQDELLREAEYLRRHPQPRYRDRVAVSGGTKNLETESWASYLMEGGQIFGR